MINSERTITRQCSVLKRNQHALAKAILPMQRSDGYTWLKTRRLDNDIVITQELLGNSKLPKTDRLYATAVKGTSRIRRNKVELQRHFVRKQPRSSNALLTDKYPYVSGTVQAFRSKET